MALPIYWVDISLPEQAVGWFPIHVSLGLVVEDGATELLRTCMRFFF